MALRTEGFEKEKKKASLGRTASASHSGVIRLRFFPRLCVSIIKNDGVVIRGSQGNAIKVSRARKAFGKFSHSALKE